MIFSLGYPIGTFRYFLLRNDLNGILVTPMSRGKALSKPIILDIRGARHFRGEPTALMRVGSTSVNT